MKELILEKSTPAELQFNFEEFRESVRSELKKYDLVVTVDTAQSQELLNKLKDKREDLKAKAINDFDFKPE